MGGRNSVFNNPFNKAKPTNQKVAAQYEASFQNAKNAFSTTAATAAGEGSVSRKTVLQIQDALKKLGTPSNRLDPFGVSFNEYNQQFDKTGGLAALQKMFEEEKSGSTSAGRSRLATQKMFELVAEQPGRKQTLLTPRSNTSRAIVGV